MIKAVLDELPNCWYYMPVASVMNRIGLPDFLGLYNGRFFAIEAKAGKNQPTGLQAYVLGQIRDAGGVACVVRDEQTMYNFLVSIGYALAQSD